MLARSPQAAEGALPNAIVSGTASARLQSHGRSNGGGRLLLPAAIAEPPDDCSTLKEWRALTTAAVALRKRAPRRVRRSAAAKAITRATPGRDDRRDPDVA